MYWRMLDNFPLWPKLRIEMRCTMWGGTMVMAMVAACAAAPSVSSSTDEDEIVLPPRGTDDTAASRPRADGGALAAATDAGVVAPTTLPSSFADLFARPDGATLGNGWTEKLDAYALVNGAVVQNGTGLYTDMIVRRPAAEKLLDTELSVDFVFGSEPKSDPSLFARVVDSDALAVLRGYTFFVMRDFVAIDREDGAASAPIVEGQVSPPLNMGESYTFLFRVRGTNPVELEGQVSKADGTIVKTLRSSDASAQRVQAAGQVGFGSGRADKGRWDNFKTVDLATSAK